MTVTKSALGYDLKKKVLWQTSLENKKAVDISSAFSVLGKDAHQRLARQPGVQALEDACRKTLEHWLGHETQMRREKHIGQMA